ncbi:hypothetical protein HID58_075292, partial [Brassica napus]
KFIASYNIMDGTVYQAPQRCSVFAARVVFDAKNQNEPSETKPPIIHNLSHHFSFEELNLMFLDSSKDVFIENMKQHTLYKKKTELNSIYVEEVKTSLSNAFLQADLALAKDCNKGSFLRHLMVANAGDGRAVLCRNGEAIDMSQDHKPIYLP